jgi:hypothetical protein
MQIKDGGMVENHDLYPYEAPKEGYAATITITGNASDLHWSPEYRGSYYFEAHNGQIYGRLTLDTMVDFQPPPTLFNADIYANPADSRNLEFDRAKQIKTP